ncbi:hypothetical protein ZIOFF_033250 [Zingiber officinale]|uniref:glycerophosphodiester phosphodiesterase n=1 Tax=Zingiber officinale TaxID=94328 RepID=A0A8J5GJL7_ZINOF|nr:hypothetical protein ZIOFF_033250 [Zingiber officinale]
MRSYVLSVIKHVVVNYLSSPELLFLSGIEHRFRNTTTKLIFRFLAEGIEPSTNLTYASLLKNLTYIKTFASGILVPKNYIWPVSNDNYLLPFKSIVADAHSAGLEIYASDFANDNLFSYNYSYDPLVEYHYFIDNGFFSVDGVVSDFPITPSEAIAEALKDIQADLKTILEQTKKGVQTTSIQDDLVDKLKNFSLGQQTSPRKLEPSTSSSTTPLFEDQIREYRRNQRRLHNMQQAARRSEHPLYLQKSSIIQEETMLITVFMYIALKNRYL